MSKSTKNTPIKPAEDVKDVTVMEPTAVIKELNERHKSSNQLAAALNEENEQLKAQVGEYAELMEVAEAALNEAEAKAADSDKIREEVRREITSGKVSDEIKAALEYKDKVLAEADKRAASILEEAQGKARDMAERIIKESQGRADAINEKTAQTVEVYNDTVRKLALLKRNISKTISDDELSQAEITVVEAKEAEPAPAAKTESAAQQAVPQQVAPQTEPEKVEAKPEPATGKWGQVANSRAAQAAERLRNRTGKGRRQVVSGGFPESETLVVRGRSDCLVRRRRAHQHHQERLRRRGAALGLQG